MATDAQGLKYRLVTEETEGAKVFETLAWAGYLKEWAGPAEEERPVAYLIQLLDTRIEENCLCDDGIQAQTILLGAVEKGFGGCIIKAFKNEVLRTILELPDYMKIMYVIALGKPVEKIVLEEIGDGDYKYWRDAAGTQRVAAGTRQERGFLKMPGENLVTERRHFSGRGAEAIADRKFCLPLCAD